MRKEISGKDILNVLVKLLAEQEGVKVKYEITEERTENKKEK